jgi:hypothetical protein
MLLPGTLRETVAGVTADGAEVYRIFKLAGRGLPRDKTNGRLFDSINYLSG